MKIRLAIAILCFALGCGSSQTTAPSDPSRTGANSRSAVKAAPEAVQAPDKLALEKQSPPGVIIRQDLNDLLAAGPAAILAAVVTEPVLQNGRFIGFRIARFADTAPRTIDLRAGDIILKANGRSIERPENYYAVFEDLKIATELRLEVLRNGETTTLVYPILDKSHPDSTLSAIPE